MIESSVGKGALWAALAKTGTGHHASVLLQLDVSGPNDLAAKSAELLSLGVRQHELELILGALAPPAPTVVSGRRDHPTLFQTSGRASLTLALAAAQPNQRKRALEALEDDILAHSTKPANDSRLRTFMAICGAWQVQAFPLSPTCIRCVGASFKAGGYRSAGIYFQTAVSHQMRAHGTPVAPFLRSMIRDVVRSVRRGLGPSSLKSGFDVATLARVVDPRDDKPFSLESLAHTADLMIICSWFMLRELEISFARDTHLTLHGEEVQLLVPVHKTNSMGSLTVRSLQCACGIRDHPLCPWHAAERHLIRVASHPHRRSDGYLPLFPLANGHSVTKHLLVKAFRNTLMACGVETTVQDDAGRLVEKFGGHCLRVSGAQFLAAAGIQVALIQLLGRWSSSAVERYVQSAPLSLVPQVPTEVLRPPDRIQGGRGSHLGSAVGPSPSTPAVRGPESMAPTIPPQEGGPRFISDPAEGRDSRAQLAAQRRLIETLQAEVMTLKKAIKPPDEVLVIRPRSNVVHRSVVDEINNPPDVWRTVCGWRYGSTRFFRLGVVSDTQRCCKKCFGSPDAHDQEASEESDKDTDSSSSGSSSSDLSS